MSQRWYVETLGEVHCVPDFGATTKTLCGKRVRPSFISVFITDAAYEAGRACGTRCRKCLRKLKGANQ